MSAIALEMLVTYFSCFAQAQVSFEHCPVTHESGDKADHPTTAVQYASGAVKIKSKRR